MNAETLAFWILAIASPWIIQIIKVKLGWSGDKALWLAMGTSFAIAIIAKVITGELTLPALAGDLLDVIAAVVRTFSGVFTLATALYKVLREKMGLKSVNS